MPSELPVWSTGFAAALDFPCILCYTFSEDLAARFPLKPFNAKFTRWENTIMERIKTLETRNMCESAKNGGCGECQTSCQSACKTSCGVANQQCENADK